MRCFDFRPMRPSMFLILPYMVPGCAADHWPLCSFSFSAWCMFELKRGRLLDMRRMCRVKKPWFCVENDGYPFLPILFMRADSQTTWFPLGPGKAVAGLDRPLVLMLRPGLLHPPPGPGDGLRERDIWRPGVPVMVEDKHVSFLSLGENGRGRGRSGWA